MYFKILNNLTSIDPATFFIFGPVNNVSRGTIASSVSECFHAIICSIVSPIGQLIVGMHSLKKLSTPDLILLSVIRSGIWI